MNKSNDKKSLVSVFNPKTGKYLTYAEAMKLIRKLESLDDAGVKEFKRQYELTGSTEGLNS